MPMTLWVCLYLPVFTYRWTRQQPQRFLLALLCLVVLVYSVTVIWYGQLTTDIGIRCAFDTKVQHVEPTAFPPELHPGGPPQLGDQLVRLAGRELHLWADFLRTLAILDEEDKVPRYSVGAEGGLSELEQAPPNSVVVRNGEQLVRLDFHPAGNPSDVRTAWCVLSRPSLAIFGQSLLWLAVKLSLVAIVVVALWKRPGDRALSRFFVLCLVTIGAYMGGYHWIRIATCPPLVVIFMACAVLLPAVSLHFYLVFPRPKEFVQRRPVAALIGVYSVSGVLLLVMLATYLLIVWANRWRVDEALVRTFSSLLVDEIYVALVVAPILFLGCLVSLAHSFFASVPGSRERNQVKWILTGALLATLPISYTLYLALTETERFGLGGVALPMFAASLCFTLAYGVSISRYGLMDVDKVLNWGIVSVGVSVAAGVVYTTLVFVGTLLIGSRIEAQSPLRQAAWVSITALLLLIGLDLFRWRWRKAIDRKLHRERYQLDRTLRRMSEAVEQLVDPPTLARRLLLALSELLGFERASIYLGGSAEVYRRASALGTEPPLPELANDADLVQALAQNPLVRVRRAFSGQSEPAQRQLELLGAEIALPLRHEAQLMGILLVGPRRKGAYDVEELHLLTTFAQIAALALHGAQGHQTIDGLNRELRTKVEKISEQQRRIAVLQSQLLRQSVAENPAAPEANGVGMGSGSSPSAAALNGIVGSSTVIQHLLHTVRKVAASPSAVLIRGESGTGKELLARALHEHSPRAGGPFVKVHCAALSPSLLESELFGHVKGAFTGAHRDKVGRFELASGGSLFLDEIGDISLDVQTKLLRVLQEMTFERVGSSEPIKVDVRIIAATNQNLERLMREGKFREDLFYRLNVITIRTPPLRERREDIYELALHFLKLYSQRSGKGITQIDEEALEALKAYDWPGNIRELENVIERAVVLVEGPVVALNELPEELVRSLDQDHLPVDRSENGAPGPGREELGLSEAEWSARQEALERDRLLRALAASSGNKARAARALGMPRSTLLSKLEKYGLAGQRSA